MARERSTKKISLRKDRRNIIPNAAFAFSGCLIRKFDPDAPEGADEVCVEVTIEVVDHERGIARITGLIDLPEE
ncbi:MAG: hypothetical protein Q8O19_05695 [Rectinemataceae bacterium]|nr:hypothetical protein [Rectinemataceae bacterium]